MERLSESLQGYLIWLSSLDEDNFAKVMLEADSVISDYLDTVSGMDEPLPALHSLQKACMCFYISLPHDFCPFSLLSLMNGIEEDLISASQKIAFLFTGLRRLMVEGSS